ncbi:MAG: hypothetical protein D6815_06480 [Candidatus Dadabacteria bacterium]|nr:MAG: hypothetical protein D6815_06480 [Candidatus Dadabacteria bacterium]
MYERYYGLGDQPFRLTPDPKYLYLSSKHREAYAHLLYALTEGSGFVAVTGEIGTGKTTLVRALLRESPKDVSVAYVFNPVLTATELLQTINAEFGLPSRSSNKKELVEALNEFLLARKSEGGRGVVIVDEAQNLDSAVLEELRLLSNLETEDDKLLQIILLGQPELRGLLERPELRQLAQRIDLRWHLEPLDREETHAYVRHRLKVAGGDPDLFEPRAIDVIHDHSGGVPRLINVLAHRSLLVGYTRGLRRIGPAEVSLAAVELAHGRVPIYPRPTGWLVRLGAGLAVTVAAGLVAFLLVAPLGDHQDGTPVMAAVDSRGPHGQNKPAPAGRRRTHRAVKAKAAAGAGLKAGRTAANARRTSGGAAGEALAKLDDLLPRVSAFEGTLGAVSRYLELWSGHPLTAAERAVDTIDLQVLGARRSLRYVALAMPLELLERIGLPAIVELGGREGLVRFALLEKLGAERAYLVFDRPVVVSRSDLEAHWYGRVHLLWRDAMRLSGLLAPGNRGPAVFALQRLLHELGLLEEQPTGVYDHTTREAVRALQRSRGLEETGTADPLTQIALYAALERFPHPTLLESKAEAGSSGRS